MRKVVTILGAGLLGACLVAAVLAGYLSCLWLLPIGVATPIWRLYRRSSLFADTLLVVFGLALACLPISGLAWLSRLEAHNSARCFDLARLEQLSQPLPALGKFQLCGSVYLAARERVYTRDYGWVQPIYSRRHPRFPGNHGPDQPPSFFLTLERDRLDRLVQRFLPPQPQEGIRDQLFVRQLRTGFFQEQPSDLLVLPCVQRAGAVCLTGLALLTLGLSMLIANLGQQYRAIYHVSRWDRPLGD